MQQSEDTVFDAYYGSNMNPVTAFTRERINWICERATGEKILDIGCSQGISAILLGRAGKFVEAIDIDNDAIEYAKLKLSDENLNVRERVKFVNEDFLKSNFSPGIYDTIIVGDLLQQVLYPYELLEKTIPPLKVGGSLIITVPFGNNNSIDHVRTYYGFELCLALSSCFDISEIHVINHSWLCLSFTKRDGCEFSIDTPLIKNFSTLEKSNYFRERQQIFDLAKIQNELIDCRNINGILSAEVKDRTDVLYHLKTELGPMDDIKNNLIILNEKIIEFVQVKELLNLLLKWNQELAVNNSKITDLSTVLNNNGQKIGAVSTKLDIATKQTHDTQANIKRMISEQSSLLQDIVNAMDREKMVFDDLLRDNENMIGELKNEINELSNSSSKKSESLDAALNLNDELKNQLDERQKQIEDLSLQKLMSEKQKKDTDNKIQLLSKEINDLKTKLDKKNSEVIDLNKKISSNEISFKNLSDKVNQEIKEEKRLLKEYNIIKTEHEKNKKRIIMYEKSKSGVLLKKMWKVIGKIKNNK